MVYEETNKGPYATFFKTAKDIPRIKHLTDDEFEVLNGVVRDFGFKRTEDIVSAAKQTEHTTKQNSWR